MGDKKKHAVGGDEDWPATTTATAELRRCAALVLPYLPPSALAAAALTCKQLASAALAIASSRASDAARGLEPHPIPFLNAVDARRYSYFVYTPISVLSCSALASQPWGPESEPRRLRPGTKSASFLVFSGCGCEGLCSIGDDGDCPCLSECGEDCGCGVDCGNRRTQGGIAVRLKVVMGRDKGWGLHAAQLIRKAEFICEYAGELLTTEEARKRQIIYDQLKSKNHVSSLLVVREHLPSGKACLRINIDATRVGNVARFLNHSCDGGNLSTLLVRNAGTFVPRLCFFAARDIMDGEELCFSYGDARLRENGRPCFCGASSCIGVLPSEFT